MHRRTPNMRKRIMSFRGAIVVTFIVSIAYVIDQYGLPAKFFSLKCPPAMTNVPVTNGPANKDATVEVTLQSMHNFFHYDDEQFPFLLTIKNKHHTMTLPRGTTLRVIPPKKSVTFRGHLLHELENELIAGHSRTVPVVIKQEHRPQNISYVRSFPDEFSIAMQIRNKEGKYEDHSLTYDRFSFNTTMFLGEIARAIQCPAHKKNDFFNKRILLFGPTGTHKTTLYCVFKNALMWGRCDEDILKSPRHVTHMLKSFKFELGYGYRLTLTDNIGNSKLDSKFCTRILQGQIPEGVNITKKPERERLLKEMRAFDIDFERDKSKYYHMFPKVMMYVMTTATLDDPVKINKMERLFKEAETYGITSPLVITNFNHSDVRHQRVFQNWLRDHMRYSYHLVNTPQNANERSSIPFSEGTIWFDILVSALRESCGRGFDIEFNNERSDAFDSGCVRKLARQTNIWETISATWAWIWSVRFQFMYMFTYVTSVFS